MKIAELTSKIDFTNRYNRVFFTPEQLGHASALFTAACEALTESTCNGIEIRHEDDSASKEVGDLWRAIPRDPDDGRKVTLGRSMNGNCYVSMENVDA